MMISNAGWENFAAKARQLFPEDLEIHRALDSRNLRNLNRIIGKAANERGGDELTRLYASLRRFITARTC